MQLLEPRSMRLTFFTAFIVQAIAIIMMWLAPCWYGSATWQAQQVIFAIGIALAGFMAIHIAIAAVLGDGTAMPNALSWTFFALGGLGLLQAQPVYSWYGNSVVSPPSIAMQRWALGKADPPAAISEGMISSDASRMEKPLKEHCALKEVPEEMKRLSLSVDPMTTRGAAGSLFLAGLLVWIGSSLFSRRNLYPILLGATIVLGIVIALLGILNVLIPASRQWIGMSGNSYATFVSKNSAGAFLNVALASACGFAIWAFHRAWKSKRHRSQREWQGAWEAGPFSVVREVLAKLDAVQIASILVVAWVATAVFVSLSRGAAVSAIAAGLATVIVILPGKHRSFAIFGALLVAALAVGLMVFFQLDEQVSTRLESLGEIDMETEAVGGRLYIWNVSWRAASFYGWLGSGLGTFHYSSLPFQRPSSMGWFYHAESIYCETLVTLGFVGTLAILAAIVGCFHSLRSIYVSRRFSDFAPMQTTGMFLLVSQAVHGAVDFALILPGVYIPSALLMGAALGGYSESLRIIQKLKRKKGEEVENAKDISTSDPRPSLFVTIPSLVAALGCMLLLNHCRQAAIPLAVAETLEQEFQQEDKLGIEDRKDSRVEKLIERAAQSGVTINDSSCLMRLAAKSICFDDRRKQWKSRMPDSDPRLSWTETAPFIIRLAYDRVDDTNREAWLHSIGGEARLASLRKAQSLYAKARSQSPLDWQSLWGSIHTSLDCSTAELAFFAPVMQRTSGHLPQLLTSAAILFNDCLSNEDRIRLWKSTLQCSPASSTDIGRLMSRQYEDEAAPVEIFPDNPNILYGLAREVFVKKAFPRTHAILCRRATESVSAQSNRSPSATALLLADIASEAGYPHSEIKHLSLYLQYKPEDVFTWIRQINLQIQVGKWDDADRSLRKLKQTDRKHPAIPELSKKIMIRSQSD